MSEVVRCTTLTCPKCGTWFGVQSNIIESRRSDGECFYCPNGHPISYTENDRTRLEKAEVALRAAKCEAMAAKQREDAERRAKEDAELKLRKFRRHMEAKHGIKSKH